MATKGIYVPKEHVSEVKPLLADYYRLKQSYAECVSETARLDGKYSQAIANNEGRLEAQSKWQLMKKQEGAAWFEMCLVMYKLRTEYGVNL